MSLVNNLNVEDYRKGSKLALRNAENLLKSSRTISESGDYGLASSLMILAFEELSKATVLRLKSFGHVDVHVKQLQKYFFCHRTKQNSLKKMVPAIFQVKLSQALKSESDNTSYWERNTVVIVIILLLVFWQSKSRTTVGLEENLDTFKKSGFYVEFDKELEDWRSPVEISQERFENLQLEVDAAFSILKESLFKNDLTVIEVNQLKEVLKTENLLS